MRMERLRYGRKTDMLGGGGEMLREGGTHWRRKGGEPRGEVLSGQRSPLRVNIYSLPSTEELKPNMS